MVESNETVDRCFTMACRLVVLIKQIGLASKSFVWPAYITICIIYSCLVRRFPYFSWDFPYHINYRITFHHISFHLVTYTRVESHRPFKYLLTKFLFLSNINVAIIFHYVVNDSRNYCVSRSLNYVFALVNEITISKTFHDERSIGKRFLQKVCAIVQ